MFWKCQWKSKKKWNWFLIILHLAPQIQNIIIFICDQYKEINQLLHTFFFFLEIWYVFDTECISVWTSHVPGAQCAFSATEKCRLVGGIQSTAQAWGGCRRKGSREHLRVTDLWTETSPLLSVSYWLRASSKVHSVVCFLSSLPHATLMDYVSPFPHL